MYWLLSIFAIALLVMNKVCVRCSKEVWAVIKQAKSPVAMSAKYSSDRSSGVIVIQCERAWVAARRSAASAFANCANATLDFKHRVVFVRLYTEFLSPVAVSRLASRFIAIFLAPFRLLISSACTTKPLHPVALSFVQGEVGNWFNSLAAPTPLHSIGGLRSTLVKFVVAAKVFKWLPLYPTKGPPIPLSDVRRPAASAFAKPWALSSFVINHG